MNNGFDVLSANIYQSSRAAEAEVVTPTIHQSIHPHPVDE